jgi:hypothetical protein
MLYKDPVIVRALFAYHFDTGETISIEYFASQREVMMDG